MPYHKDVFSAFFRNFFQICKNGHFQNVQNWVGPTYFGTKKKFIDFLNVVFCPISGDLCPVFGGLRLSVTENNKLSDI